MCRIPEQAVNSTVIVCLYSLSYYQGYKGCAIGKNKQGAKTELEKLKFSEVSARDLIKEAARM